MTSKTISVFPNHINYIKDSFIISRTSFSIPNDHLAIKDKEVMGAKLSKNSFKTIIPHLW